MDNFIKYYTPGGLHPEEAECIYNLINKYNISSIVEIGCGISSTQLFLDCVNELFTYESNQEWADLISKTYNHNIKKYTPGELNISETPDLIFIDGPSGSENREDSFISSVGKSKYVLVHDSLGVVIQCFINTYFKTDNLYNEIPLPPLHKTSGITLLKRNE